MKKIISFFTIISLILAFSLNGKGQINRTINTKVADALAQVPTIDDTRLNALMSEMAALKEEGFALFVAKIVPAGTGDDVAARFVVASLAKYVSQYGKLEDKLMVERGLQRALLATSDKDVQSFYLSQLYFVATDLSVGLLSLYLPDEKLCDASVKVLLAIGSPSAGYAMLKDLDKAQGIPALALAKAVGDLKVETANPVLVAKLGSADPKLQRVILASLAQIAANESFSVLTGKASKAKYLYEPTGIVSSLITYADRLGKKGELALCEKTLSVLLANCKETNQLQYRSATLAIKAKYRGMESLPLLLKEFDNSDKAYRAGVMNLAAKMTDISAIRQWLSKSTKVSSEKKAEIVEMLGRSGNKTILPAFGLLLSDLSAEVRVASVDAIANIREEEAVKVLEDHLIKGLDAAATAKALSRRLDDNHIYRLCGALDDAPKAAKVEIIRLIGSKAAKHCFGKIFACTSDADQEVSLAAFGALKNLSSEEDTAQLLDLLRKATSKEQISAVQLALVHASAGMNNEKTSQFISQLNQIADPGRTLGIYASLAGREALKKVVDSFESTDHAIQEAAFTALVKWRNTDAADALYQICAANPSYQAKAYKGFVDLVAHSALPDDQKLLQYRKVMPLAANKEQKLMVVGRLGDLKTFPALLFISNFLDDKDLQAEATSSAMSVALPGSGKTVGLTGELVKDILNKSVGLISGPESDYDKEKVRKYLASMPDEKGYVPMFNGKDLTGWKGLVGNPITRAKMTAKELAAKQVEADAKAAKKLECKRQFYRLQRCGR